MNRLNLLFIFFPLLLFCSPARASSPDDWRQHFQEVRKTCIKESGLVKAQAISEIIVFGDEVGYDALLIKGHYPQPHMKNTVGKSLCLFNRKTRKAKTVEAYSM